MCMHANIFGYKYGGINNDTSVSATKKIVKATIHVLKVGQQLNITVLEASPRKGCVLRLKQRQQKKKRG